LNYFLEYLEKNIKMCYTLLMKNANQTHITDKQKEKIIIAIMQDKIGNLEHIVEHWVTTAPQDTIEQYLNEYKTRRLL